jgi:hypothetical protein
MNEKDMLLPGREAMMIVAQPQDGEHRQPSTALSPRQKMCSSHRKEKLGGTKSETKERLAN